LVCSFFSSPSAVPMPATPAASIAAAAAFVATRASFDPAPEKARAFDFGEVLGFDDALDFDDTLDFDDALAFAAFFTFDLAAARFGGGLDFVRFPGLFMVSSCSVLSKAENSQTSELGAYSRL
jgi:hypothetical protein